MKPVWLEMRAERSGVGQNCKILVTVGLVFLLCFIDGEAFESFLSRML